MTIIFQQVKKAFFVVGVSFSLVFSNAVFSQPGSYTDLGKAPAGEYQLDKTHAYVAFSYLHQGYSRPLLLFRSIDGALQLNPKDVSKSVVNISIDPASIQSGVELFDQHLRDEEHFFDVKKYTEITFASTQIEMDDNAVIVTGDLTMKGVTKPVTLRGLFNKGGLHFKTKNPVLGFSATGTLSRSDWDLGYAVPVVGDEVSITVEVEFWKTIKE